MALLGQGEERFHRLGRPPAAPRAERKGVGLQVSRTRGDCSKGFFDHAPRHQGDSTKGWLQGTIVERLVTVRAAGRQTELPVSALARLGPAA